MTIAENISDVISFAYSLGDICLLGAIIGCAFTLVACACVLSFPVEYAQEPAATPPITVLKPLHDEEPGLPARLAAFCRQDYDAPIQVLCGTQDQASPAAAMVRAMEADFADRGIELVVGSRCQGVNRKVSNLVNMMPRARYDTLVLSDSDIVVGPGYLRALTALLAKPDIGAVTCLYHGIGGAGLWTRLSALAINSQFLPHAITAVSLGLAKPCCGATIAMRRSTLDRIGGFGALADVLADDHAIGVGVRAAGNDVVTAPFLVGHRCFEGSLRELFRQQIRVARTIKSIDPIAYAGTIVTHPWPLALVALLSGSPAAALVAAIVLLSRITLCRCVEWRFDLPRQNYWLIPLQDVVAFGVYVTSFFGATVHWRGADYRVMADGTLLEGQDLRGS
ncbi:MAG: bacteriohopanetetrol glucosamine biosynthesis glycosyltransferase HpnI [Xanthobacteraceae bacterium]|nr:bacteriohopanetetrol glucosamine biosynthesis glycosyltransferase HpnI [Xanthobacteraceae bacterium]